MKECITVNKKEYDFNSTLKIVTDLPLIEGIEIIGIHIPNFCYNQELSIAGNCRMCFIETKNAIKPIISCAVNLKSYLNSEIFTESPLVFKSRESILEFLLLNHPIDCTICDQAGECDLQDHSLIHGVANKRFYNYKRVVDDKYVGPIIKTAMTRCIHCTRCIRFGSEIAGLKEFGIFGRGVNSEIGIYKLNGQLTSELSGNLIDLCPVGSFSKKNNNSFFKMNTLLIGALTGRPYPFTIRVWEHLFKSTIDCCDGFGQSIRAGIAYNKLRRLIPNLITNTEDTPWINDRTRFAFEGLPLIYALEPTLMNKKKISEKKTTVQLVQSLIFFFYFFDHLNNHLVQICSFIVIFGTSISLELMSLLLFTFSKYSFLTLKNSERLPQKNDLESNFQLNNSVKDIKNLLKSDLCLLIGVNTRYEGSYLNLKLRKRYLQNDFNIMSLGALLDLTFPIFTIGSILSLLKFILEGTNLITQSFKTANYPMLVLNSNYFKRFDSKNFTNFIEILKSFSCFSLKNWNGLNVLNSSLNDVGANSVNRFLPIKSTDLINYNVIYFFKSPFYIFSIKKFLELNSLNFLTVKNNYQIIPPKILVYQTSIMASNFWIEKIFKKSNISQNYFFILSKSFYNSAETFINTEGLVKKSSNVVASSSELKDDWKFLRRVFTSTTKNIMFIKDLKNEKRITFKSASTVKFTNYLAFQLFPIKVYNRLLFAHLLENKSFDTNANTDFFLLLNKIFSSKIIFWLVDFYLGNRDLYSRHSKTMTNCSTYFRINKLNFFIGWCV